MVLPGPVQDAVFVLRMLQRALLLDPRPLPTSEHRRVAEWIAGVLAISDAVARRAGLDPFMAPHFSKLIKVPSPPEVDRLARAVRWTDRDATRLEGGMLTFEALAQPKAAVVERLAGAWLVAAPELLVAQLNEQIIDDFRRRDAIAELQDRYERAVWASVTEAMTRLGANQVDNEPSADGLRAHFRFASAHTVHVLQPPSSLENMPGDERIRAVDALAAPLIGGAGATDIVLIVSQPLSDPYLTSGGSESGAFPLAMAAADLEILAQLPGAGPFTLLRFARSAARARARSHVTRFSTLDEYYVYRELGERHPSTPVGEAIDLLAGPGSALPLRIQVARARGTDAAAFPDDLGIAEVTRRFRAEVPIYVPPPQFPASARVVLLQEVTLWLIGHDDDQHDRSAIPIDEVLDSLALFAALAAQEVPEVVMGLSPVVRVDVVIAVISTLDGVDPEAGDAALAVHAVAPAELRIIVDPTFAAVANAPTNEADRALLSLLVTGLRSLAGSANPASISDVVDRVADPGRRRLLTAIDAGSHPAIGPPDVRDWTAISNAEAAIWDDELAVALWHAGYRRGDMRGAEAREVLNRSVAYLFGRLSEEIRPVALEPALVSLVERMEAIYRAEGLARLRLTTAPDLFGADSGEVTQLRLDLLQTARAALSTRFLIEYLGACAPAGDNWVSELDLDRLLALASRIVELGMTSDAMWLGTTPAEVSFAPSGRLIRPDPGRGDVAFYVALEEHKRRRHDAAYEERWRDVSADEFDSELTRAADAAYAAETGVSLTDIATLLNAATLYGDDHNLSVVAMPVKALIGEAANCLGWARPRVRRVLEQLTFTARPYFLEPPPPYRREDVYPWRFSRELSYLRRPFVRLEGRGHPRLVFGTRALFVAAVHLSELVESGRLRAHSAQMQQLMGEAARARSEAFVADVAQICRQSGLEVWTGIHKVGGVRVGAPHRDLGDLDVIASDFERRRLWIIECKAMSAARTAWEAGHELREFVGSGGHLTRHAKRVDWVRHRLADVVADLGLPLGEWYVRGVVATEMPLPTAFRGESHEISIIDASGLAAYLRT